MALAQEDRRIVMVRVVPSKKIVYSGHKFRFFAFAYNRDNEKVSFTPEWSATGGAITDDGWFTAGNREAVYSVMATDPHTGAQGSATVMVRRLIPRETRSAYGQTIVRLKIFPVHVELAPMQRIQFAVRAYNAAGSEVDTGQLLWKVTGGSVTSSGLYQAGGAPGKYLVQVQVPDGAVTTAEVFIRGDLGRVATLKISPTRTRLKPNEEQRFFVTGFNSSGAVVSFSPYWQATGGSIDQYGIYRAGAVPGSYFVKAIAPDNVSSTATVVIEPVLVQRVEIWPQSATLYPGQIQKFSAQAYDANGSSVPAMALWSAEGGQIDSDGNYRAGSFPGHYRITVTIGQISVQRHVVIRAASYPIRLSIYPKNVSLQPGQAVRFTATAYDQQGQPVATAINWQAQGGSLDASGLYRAGVMPGAYQVRASVGNSIFAEATVVISSSGVYEPVAKLTIAPAQLDLNPGESATFLARGFDSYGRKISCALSWQASGGTITANGLYRAGATPGTYQVMASTASGVSASAIVNIIAAEPEVPTDARLVVKPKKATLEPGETCIFIATLRDRSGRVLPARFQWQATGGTIDSEGNYQAGNEPGKYAAIVTDLGTGRSRKVAIKITEASTQPKIKPFQVLEWKIGDGDRISGNIFLKVEVNAENAHLLKLVLISTSGVEKILVQRKVKAGYIVTFQGNYIRKHTRIIAVILTDAELRELHRWQHKP